MLTPSDPRLTSTKVKVSLIMTSISYSGCRGKWENCEPTYRHTAVINEAEIAGEQCTIQLQVTSVLADPVRQQSNLHKVLGAVRAHMAHVFTYMGFESQQ